MQGLLVRLLICMIVVGVALYRHIDDSNQLTGLRLAIPILEKDVKEIAEENTRLQFEIDRFESPAHLLELARKPEFGHLKYPYADDIIIFYDCKKSTKNEITVVPGRNPR